MTDCLTSVADALNGFAPISLDEMGAVKLMNRTDTKFVINVTQLLRILDFAILLSAKVFPSDIKNRLNPHDEDSAFSFICFLLPKHINDEQKYTF